MLLLQHQSENNVQKQNWNHYPSCHWVACGILKNRRSFEACTYQQRSTEVNASLYGYIVGSLQKSPLQNKGQEKKDC